MHPRQAGDVERPLRRLARFRGVTSEARPTMAGYSLSVKGTLPFFFSELGRLAGPWTSSPIRLVGPSRVVHMWRSGGGVGVPCKVSRACELGKLGGTQVFHRLSPPDRPRLGASQPRVRIGFPGRGVAENSQGGFGVKRKRRSMCAFVTRSRDRYGFSRVGHTQKRGDFTRITALPRRCRPTATFMREVLRAFLREIRPSSWRCARVTAPRAPRPRTTCSALRGRA
jgi:hypothetical protein